MPNKKISEFQPLTNLSLTDVILLNHNDTTYTATIQAIRNLLFPAGTVFYMAGNVNQSGVVTLPPGFLECNGASYNRTDPTYINLFNVIGFTWGGGGNYFNVPDLRGEFIRGWDHGRNLDVGRAFGTVQTDDLKSHSHTLNKVLQWPRDGGGVTEQNQSGGPEDYNGYAYNTGSTGGTETRPRNVAMIGIISY